MMIAEDLRTLTLLDWLENDLLFTIENIAPASSDASFRRYFRIKTADGYFIVMDAPPEKENIKPFIKVAELMANAGINVPAVHRQNLVDGFLLLEDFGSRCFLDELSRGDADALYQSALDNLFRQQSEPSLQNCDLPRYDDALLTRELGVFNDWFVNQLQDIEMPADIWQATQAVLVASALEQPICCVHRDYHSRNLMVLDHDSPGVIDFQDAVIGPITYDLVSLLRDCYIAWPAPQVEEWRDRYFQRLQQAGLISCAPARFKRWFDLMGMQRHLKAIGIFSRLHLRDGKSGYLDDIPRTLGYVVTVCSNYAELADFKQFLKAHILPVYGISA
ncbi:MAG: aminoglycoside phosphotransferase [Methylovulum sp.]|nr:MAG: aminoglycoside phosphotransferase [Methylovulum sp.]